MTAHDVSEHHARLRAWAKGIYGMEAATELLIRGFDGRFADPELPASYNVAPTQTSAVVLERPPRDEKTAAPVRQLRNLKWGLLPVYAILLGSGLTARMGPLLRRQARRPLRRMVSRRCLGSALMCLSTWDRCP